MQDSNITYTVKAVGIEEATAKMNALGATIQKLTVNQNGTVTATGKLTSTLEAQAGATNKVASATDRASKAQGSYFGHIAKTTVQSALINKLFLELVDVSGQAIKQVDLMNNFPATMASMGQSTEASSVAFQKLRDYVGQVGGNLGDAASMVTRFTGVTKDVQASVAIFSGLNNALIAGDSNLQEQAQSAVQFAQAFERGKPDMKEWLSLTQNMSFQLGLVAKEMGYVNASTLGEALRTGEENMGAFTAKLTELSTGTGPIAQQALARMNGMQFAFNVMKNTMVQGLATIINTFGRTNIVSFFTFLTQVIQVVTQAVVVLIGAFFGLINIIRGLFGLSPLEGLKKDAEGVAGGIGGAAGAADDLGDGLKGAKKDAAALNKSLAGFDKMNVLPEKTSGSGGKDDEGKAGGTEFDGAQMGALGDAFGNIGAKLQEASFWAKVFAGILGGIAALKFGLGMLDQLNKMIDTTKTAKKNIQDLGTKLDEMGKKAKDNFAKVGQGAGNIGSSLGKGAGNLATAIAGFVGGIAGGIGAALAPALGGVITTIGTAIGAALAGLAATLGLPIWAVVAIIAAVVAAIVALVWLIASNWDTIVKFITDVFTGFWNWLVETWNTLYAIFEGPVKFIWQFIEAVFIVIVAIIATALQLVFNTVVGTVQMILGVLGTIAGWVFENVIKPVAEYFKKLWDDLIKAVTMAWQWIFNNVLAPIGGWINANVIGPIANFFKGLWDKVTGFISGFVAGFYNIIRPVVDWINRNVVQPIGNFFKGLWDGIKNGLSGLMDGLRNIFGGLANIFKSPMNGVIDILNSMFRKLNQTVKVPDWVPGLGGKSANFPMIPRLARGGVVEQATLAMIGEDGQEAVVPLENNLEWIDKLAAKINANGTGGGQPLALTVQIGEERIVTKVIDLINEKTQMSGRNKILV